MTPDVAQALAQLCRAARRAPLDTDALVAAFVGGILARGPVDPDALLEVLNAACITDRRWQAAAAAFDSPAWTRRRPLPRAGRYLASLLRRGE